MGQKVNPISNRLGIIRGWDSNWFGGRSFGDNIVEDSKIRKYIETRLEERQANSSVSKIVIERTLKLVTVTICTSRPGLIIGKGGQEVDKLKEELKKLTEKDIQINIFGQLVTTVNQMRQKRDKTATYSQYRKSNHSIYSAKEVHQHAHIMHIITTDRLVKPIDNRCCYAKFRKR